ncbi:Arginine exporter protein ArgO [Amycolatopsis sp. M39]|uniref:LysE type translocator n=1 Tax=Amycolatopsis rubida TaxID=112413 RepID=A0A1I6A6N4_9PSEU|nr:Arginine exporter protein ArgO [Amycolatopsis sp. M39]SFQ64310.1 LysE type translocator [Amycolatopsis rubida]
MAAGEQGHRDRRRAFPCGIRDPRRAPCLPAGRADRLPRRPVLALTWLNPHVYLDTVLLLGSVAAGHGDGRWLFGIGAVVASAVSFSTLGLGARRLSGVFTRPTAWRVLDGVIALGVALLLQRGYCADRC